jgi:PAS domain S-box-containing protein
MKSLRVLRVLIVEDSEDDAEALLRELRRGDFAVEYRRVQTAGAMREALRTEGWDLIVSDYSMPQFSATAALTVLRESGLDLPFILVSGTIGEETSVEALKAGAHDFLIKGRLPRLVPAVERGLREAQVRRDRRRAEEALRESELKYRRIVETSQEGIWLLDGDYRTTYVNNRMAEMLGSVPEMMVGRPFAEFLDDEPRGLPLHGFAQPERLLAGQQVVKFLRRDGAEFWASVSSNPITDDAGCGVGVLAMVTDITEQRRLQAQLMTSDRMASMGMLAAGVVHEIHNPLAAVLANLDLAVGDLTDLDRRFPADNTLSAALAGVRDAHAAAERIRQIVRDVRIFSRADDEPSSQMDVQRVLDSTVRMAWSEIRHRARLTKDYQPVPLVRGNESRLGQVFLNLIVNAAQSISEGNAEANEIRLTTRTAADGRVLVEVRDTGCGMNAETRKRLFAPFFTTKARGVGTGLGLSISQRLITTLGGEIEVESAPGSGSTFRVFLPAAPRPTTEEQVSRPSLRTVSGAGTRGRILIIDDEPMILNVTRRALGGQHDVTTATGGKEGLNRIQSGERFDVIVCDLMMPDLTGMDLEAALERIAPDQAGRMVFLTDGAFTSPARAFLDRMSGSMLEKPFDPRALLALVNERLLRAEPPPLQSNTQAHGVG